MNVFAFGVCPSIEGEKSWGFHLGTADDCKSRCSILCAPVSTVYKSTQHTSKHFPPTIKGPKKCSKIVKTSSPILKDVETLPLPLPRSGCPCQCNPCGGEGLLQVFQSFYQTRVRSLANLVSNCCLVHLIDVTLACEDAKSKLSWIFFTDVDDEDRVCNSWRFES